MNLLIEPFKGYKNILLTLLAATASFVVLWANVLMYQVNIPNSGITFIEAQRLWTKGLVLCILYLCVLLTTFYRWRLDTIKIVSLLSHQMIFIRIIFSNAIFLAMVALPVVINMMGLFEKPLTVSKSFPMYYWICVFTGVLTFLWVPIKITYNKMIMIWVNFIFSIKYNLLKKITTKV